MNPLRTYDYLMQSRARVFDWVRPLSDEQYRQEHPIGLGSLARTLHHIRAAEWLYMQRVRGNYGTMPAPALEHDPEVSTESALPFGELERGWIEQAHAIRSDLAAVSDWDTPQTVSTAWDGTSYTYEASAADYFTQLALHEAHHRAQAMHMLRRLDVKTDEIDFNALMWTMVKQP